MSHRERALLDDKDWKILKILVSNARTPFSRIAKEVGLSESSVYVRVRRLEKLGILRGYTANIDISKLGYNVQALIMVRLKPSKYHETLRILKDFPYAVEVYEVVGEFHVVMRVLARSNEELSKIIDELGSIQGVDETRTIYILRVMKEMRTLVP